MAVDQDRLMEFLGRFVTDLGATVAAGSVVVGHRLGLYRALATEPATPAQLAERTGTDPRYVAEWLAGQAAGDYIRYDASTGSYSMTEEQAFALADPLGPNVSAAFVMALGMLRAEPRITEAFRTGAGVGWHEQHPDVFAGTDAFFRAGYAANLVPVWLPAMDGVEAKLRGRRAGRRCGLRVRRVVGAARPGLPGIDGGGLGLPRAPRSTRPASVPPTPEWPTARRSRWRRRRPSPGPATTW